MASLLNLMIYCDVKTHSTVFPVSTEMQIGKIRNLINKAPKGIYLTVGGERAFRGGSMFEDIEQLVILDISPIITRYGKINIELLKSKNKEDYKHLRWESDFSEWQKISSSLTSNDFKWWSENVRNMKGYDLPEMLNRYGRADKHLKIHEKFLSVYPKVSRKYNNSEKRFLNFVTWEDIQEIQIKFPNSFSDPLTKEEFDHFDKERKCPGSCAKQLVDNPRNVVDWGQVIDYKSGNYLFDDKLYDRLHDLALTGKIHVIEADMTKQKGLDVVGKLIQKTGSKLAVLDLDNLYLYDYMGEEKFRTALSYLIKYGEDSSVLILMSNYKDYACAQFSIYVGFTFEHIQSWPKEPFFDVFINSIPSEILPLIDGRLYEGKEEMPFYLKGDKLSRWPHQHIPNL